MQNKFKSELANRIAEKKRPWSPRQLGVLVAAVAACVLIVGATALSLPITANGSGNSPVSFEALFEQDQDYLVPVEVTDDEGNAWTELQHVDVWTGPYDIMKISKLKKDTFNTPGLYAKTYTKFVYIVTVKLASLDHIDLTDGVGLTVAHVEISGVGLAEQLLMGASLSINDIEQVLAPSDFVADNREVGVLIDTLVIDVVLPDLGYVVGDEVTINLMYKSALADWAGGWSEDAFPGIDDYVAPEPEPVPEP